MLGDESIQDDVDEIIDDATQMFTPWDPAQIDKLQKQMELYLARSGVGVTILLGKRMMRSAVTKCRRVLPDKTDEDIANKITEMYNLKGLKIVTGRWTKVEENIIKQNAREYLQIHNMTIDEVMRMPAKEKRHFIKHCAINIDRPYLSLYKKCIRMFDRTNHIGTYTSLEIKHLKKLNELHKDSPHKWKEIGEVMGRSASSIRDRITKVSTTPRAHRRTNWSRDELDRLKTAVKKYKDTENSWNKIGDEVGTRTARECLVKHGLIKSDRSRKLSVKDELVLIELLSREDVNYVSEIDWERIAEKWPVKLNDDEPMNTPVFLKNAFQKTVNFRVPLSNQLSFTDIIEILMTNFVTPHRHKGKYSSKDEQHDLSDDTDENPNNAERILMKTEKDNDLSDDMDDNSFERIVIKTENHDDLSDDTDQDEENAEAINIKTDVKYHNRLGRDKRKFSHTFKSKTPKKND